MGIKNPEKLSQKEYYRAYADYLFLTENKFEFFKNAFEQAVQETVQTVLEALKAR